MMGRGRQLYLKVGTGIILFKKMCVIRVVLGPRDEGAIMHISFRGAKICKLGWNKRGFGHFYKYLESFDAQIKVENMQNM